MTKVKKSAKNAQRVPKGIVLTARVLEKVSPRLAVRFAAKLFTTPIKHKMPLREYDMDNQTVQTVLKIPSIQKNIMVYEWGDGTKKVLLVHGWSGRGTQLFKIAETLINQGFSVVSFDAPAHGKAAGNATIMTEFIAAIQEIDKKYGAFHAAIGHSLGGMALLNAIKDGFAVNHLVTIGSGDKVKDIIDDFIAKLKLKPATGVLLQQHFEKKYTTSMDSLSAYVAAKDVHIPVLVVHDENDEDVPERAAHHIFKHLKNGEMMITKKLGHRKILGDEKVIEKTVAFIK